VLIEGNENINSVHISTEKQNGPERPSQNFFVGDCTAIPPSLPFPYQIEPWALHLPMNQAPKKGMSNANHKPND